MRRNMWTDNFLILSVIVLATSFGYNMISTGIPVFASQLGASDLAIGLVTTLATGAAMLVRPFTGLALDRFGRKGILLISIASTSVLIVAYAVFPLLGFILTLRFLHGLSWGFFTTTTSTMAVDAIPEKRFAEGMGYYSFFPAIASSFAPSLSISLLESVGIWPVVIIATSCTGAAFIFTLFQSYLDVPKTKERKKLQPDDLFDKAALLPAGISIFFSCAFASIVTFVVLHGISQGITNAYLFFTVHEIVSLTSRPIIGRVTDKSGFFLPGVLSALALAASLVLLAFSLNIILFCIAAIFSGIAMGSGIGNFQAMAIAAVPAERRGVATATFMSGLDIGVSLGAVIAGIIADAFGYVDMYLIMTVFPAIVILIFVVFRIRKVHGCGKA